MIAALSKWYIIHAILTSAWAGRIIVLILFILSVISLAIFIKKTLEFKKIGHQNKAFLHSFRSCNSLAEFHNIKAKFSGPFLSVFESAYNEIKSGASQQDTVSSNCGKDFPVLTKRVPKFVASIGQAKLDATHSLDSQLVLLATIVVISPLLGLLGTVWGILDAFLDIRTYGSAHINIVAPGMAEALITTVVGLCVAIPAVVFYNYLTNRASQLADELDAFANELVEQMRAEIL
ncbi:MAG: MotA/TolQ/ExbB proton channel family protein [Candidatus Stahlbacteria bacterium]|nr:MotA/TolQ/ExbB proton channel family protein [Candidatus Stahlbacteria bacterium]